jgi:hypothetical protein
MILPTETARLILCIGVLTLLTGCASRTVRIAATPAGSANNDYLDMQAGWRLTTVTPILKSGGYVLKTPEKLTSSSNGFTLSVGTDFVGYEVAHYDVKGQRGGRVRVEFNSAEVTKEGKTQPQPQSIAPLFQVASRANYLRLVYLIRISQADHNMAVIAGRKIDALDSLTRRVQTNPADGCKVGQRASCVWIPEGIAVRAEVLKTVDGVEKWVDAPR